MSFSVYDPRGSWEAPALAAAARPSLLAGVTVCLLDNGKEQADVMLARVEALFREKGAAIRHARKPSYSRVAPPEVIEEAARSQLVVAALGG